MRLSASVVALYSKQRRHTAPPVTRCLSYRAPISLSPFPCRLPMHALFLFLSFSFPILDGCFSFSLSLFLLRPRRLVGPAETTQRLHAANFAASNVLFCSLKSIDFTFFSSSCSFFSSFFCIQFAGPHLFAFFARFAPSSRPSSSRLTHTAWTPKHSQSTSKTLQTARPALPRSVLVWVCWRGAELRRAPASCPPLLQTF